MFFFFVFSGFFVSSGRFLRERLWFRCVFGKFVLSCGGWVGSVGSIGFLVRWRGVWFGLFYWFWCWVFCMLVFCGSVYICFVCFYWWTKEEMIFCYMGLRLFCLVWWSLWWCVCNVWNRVELFWFHCLVWVWDIFDLWRLFRLFFLDSILGVLFFTVWGFVDWFWYHLWWMWSLVMVSCRLRG